MSCILPIYTNVCMPMEDLEAAAHGSQRVGHDWATEQQQLIHTHADILFLFSH